MMGDLVSLLIIGQRNKVLFVVGSLDKHALEDKQANLATVSYAST